MIPIFASSIVLVLLINKFRGCLKRTFILQNQYDIPGGKSVFYKSLSNFEITLAAFS